MLPAELAIIEQAMLIIKNAMQKKERFFMTSPELVKNYLSMKMGLLEHEVFSVLFLDNQHQLIELREMFRGTIDAASVYPREIVKESLKFNAAAVILVHNHPSGCIEPSRADKAITDRIKSALGFVDVRVLDHFIVGGSEVYSFAERGLI